MDLALGVVGGAIGGVVGGPNGAMLGWSIGTTIGSTLELLNPPGQESGRLDDLTLTISSNAAPIPQVWGTMRTGGNVIWVERDGNGNALVEHVSTSGGKGRPRVTSYSYTASFAVLVCAGPINKIKRIGADDLVIYDDAATPKSRYTVRVYVGNETQNPDSRIEANVGSGNCPAYRGRCYVVFEDMDLSAFGNRLPSLWFEVEQSTTATLATVIGSVCDQTGIGSGLRDLTAATAAVSGYALNNRTQARNALESLLRVHAADLIEADGKVRVTVRGGSSAATVALEELGASSSVEGGGSRWEVRRTPEIELPTRLDLAYLSAGTYQAATQGAVRHTKAHLQDATTLNYSGVLGDDFARQQAERLLYTAWREAETFQLLLPPKYLFLAPADVLTVPVEGVSRRLRVEQMDITPFGEIALTCVKDETDVLTQSAVGGTGAGALPPVATALATTFLAFSAGAGGAAIELKDEDSTSAGFYVVGGGAAGWSGATIYYSPDGGTAWLEGGVLTEPSAVGTAAGTLANYTGSGFDTTNTVNVTLSVGILEPASQTEVTYGINRAVLGNEVLGFSGASLVSGTTWTLSTLLRKLRNTLGTGHGSGERFAVVENAVRVVLPDSMMGSSVKVRVVSPYQAIGDSAVVAAEQTITIGTKSGAPWATPADVTGATSGLYAGYGVMKSGNGPYTIAPDENEVFIIEGGNIPTDDSVYLPLRSAARGPIVIYMGDDTYITLKIASGSGDSLVTPNIMGGGSSSATSLVFGDGANPVVVKCAPRKGSTTDWLVVQLA